MKLLNVGGGSRAVKIHVAYDDWEQVVLDVLPNKNGVDLLMDGRELLTLPPGEYDAVWCSHNLEHYERWDVDRVIEGFAHVLKPSGFVDLRMPDLEYLGRLLAETGDMDHVVYTSFAGHDVTIGDLIYGYGPETRMSDGFRHRNGFTAATLRRLLQSRFPHVLIGYHTPTAELLALAYLESPSRTIYGQELQ